MGLEGLLNSDSGQSNSAPSSNHSSSNNGASNCGASSTSGSISDDELSPDSPHNSGNSSNSSSSAVTEKRAFSETSNTNSESSYNNEDRLEGVPPFLAKCFALVDDPLSNDFICWAPDGNSFFILNPAKFATDLLPKVFKHNNFASFVRQLNMYGFHKCVSNDKFPEFAHELFRRGQKHLLKSIERHKVPSKTKRQKIEETPVSTTSSVSTRLTLLEDLIRRQADQLALMREEVRTLRYENKAMQEELYALQRLYTRSSLESSLFHTPLGMFGKADIQSSKDQPPFFPFSPVLSPQQTQQQRGPAPGFHTNNNNNMPGTELAPVLIPNTRYADDTNNAEHKSSSHNGAYPGFTGRHT